ncbi:MAG: potassium channel family protein, partial [Parvibaculales bacterium]
GAFSSIPASMWWAIATLTTVGYGDVVPVTVAGKILGGLTSIIGIMMVALPTAIISSSFMHEFQHFRQKKQAEQQSKRRL